jgi:hypothetical protein
MGVGTFPSMCRTRTAPSRYVIGSTSCVYVCGRIDASPALAERAELQIHYITTDFKRHHYSWNAKLPPADQIRAWSVVAVLDFKADGEAIRKELLN